jgi:hypothetical protein
MGGGADYRGEVPAAGMQPANPANPANLNSPSDARKTPITRLTYGIICRKDPFKIKAHYGFRVGARARSATRGLDKGQAIPYALLGKNPREKEACQ